MGWDVLEEHIYQDAAVSGYGVDNRTSYQRMVAAGLSPSPPFDRLLIDDLSRLSRDLVETVRLYRRLRRNGVDLVAVADGIQGSHQMAKLQITIKGLVNELYLDDLREKTHRGMSGLALRGLSAGGRLFGYRTITQGPEGGAAWVIAEDEAAVVRRIFRMYVDGRSPRAIAVQLNHEGIPFPAKVTRRGPTRRGWAVSTIHTLLTNDKYRGLWVWNKTMFVKDPETGKRAPVARPREQWIEERRPDLQIIDEDLSQQVDERMKTVRSAYGVTSAGGRPKGQAPETYSPYLLSGLMRCGKCGARITISATSRKKPSGRVYRYAWYRCSFHTAKGPAICRNAMSIRHDVLEAKLLEKFREALTPAMIDYVAAAVNRKLVTQNADMPQEVSTLGHERRQVERELSNLVGFITTGDLQSPRLAEEIHRREQRLTEIDHRLKRLRQGAQTAPLQVHRSWIEAKLDHFYTLVAGDPQGARRELQKHVDDLKVTPMAEPAQRLLKITGRAKVDGLLADQEAVRLQLVAGVGFAPTTLDVHDAAQL
jgi:DNA invertase Pin-like site-specific DNA recombinase